MTEEQQVAEAALAVVRPDTDPHVRASASQFLEEWTKTEGAWEIYAAWLEHQLESDHSADIERVGMQLLCLQLLQAKIRREVPRGSSAPILERIHQCLARLLMATVAVASSHNNPPPALQPASIAYAAISVRCQGGLAHVVAQATTEGAMPPSIALRVLANIPLEVEACADLTNPQVASELQPHAETVLEACCNFMQRDAEAAALATEALERWTERCRVSLSQLNTPIGGRGSSNNGSSHGSEHGTVVVLPLLIHLLSQPQYSGEELPLKASRALIEAILVPTDACSEPRRVACETLMQAIAGGSFIAAPLQYTTNQGWENACHALATVLCTLVTEEVDFVCQQPAEALLNLLLQIQNHPQTKVGCAALECWLTVQEVPTSQRHENWKAPLFQRVVECLMNRMAFPAHFVSWQEELEIDESEFEEFRRMVKDVLVSSFFLLRVNFVRSMVQTFLASNNGNSAPWFVQEAALFALTVSSREVCARIKARGGLSVGRDREETTEQVLALAQHLCGSDQSASVRAISSRHWLVLVGACDWIGAYAAAWGAKCPPESVYQLLKFLCVAMDSNQLIAAPAAKALKNVMVGCASTLVKDPSSQTSVPQCVKESMETALIKQDEAAMINVAEGCTRLIVQLPDENAAQASLGVLVAPLVQRCDAALQLAPADVSAGISEQASEALEALNKQLASIQVVIRFCERKESNSASELMNSIWPCLERASQKLVAYEPLLKKTLAIHEQLLKNLPALVAPKFEATMKYVVNIFETSKDPSSLAYMASAVEAYGGKNLFDFDQLLTHVFGVLSPFLSSRPFVDSCAVIAAFFQLAARYLLFCPVAIACNQTLPDIVALAVTCLTQCKGEGESTREALNFLAKFYSWRTLPYSEDDKAAIRGFAQRLDEIMVQQGPALIQSCIEILLGGSQILWGSSSDCVFAVVSSATPGNGEASIARQWLQSVHTKPEHTSVYGHVIELLLVQAREPQHNKAKSRLLLTDYAAICKGQTSPDALLSYSLS